MGTQPSLKRRPARRRGVSASRAAGVPPANLTGRELLMVLWVVGVLAAFWRIFIGMLG